MKILLIAEDLVLKNSLSAYFKPRGYSLIHYTNPLKGMNNFEEIEPELVLFNSIDYPRHWKIANNFLKRDVTAFRSLFFLVISSDFPMEEVCKGKYLGIDALISNDFTVDGYMKNLETLIGRFHSSQRANQFPILGNLEKKIDFMFMNPENFQLTTGSLEEFSSQGGGFKPDDPKSVFSLQQGLILEACSLRTDEGIITIKAEILNNSGIMDLKFLEFAKNGEELLNRYIRQ